MIFYITGNNNKFKEAKILIPNIIQKKIDLPEIQELDLNKIIDAKLDEAIKHTNEAIIVEDVALEIHALNKFPGPLIKWMLSVMTLDELYKLIYPYENKKATVKIIVGYANKNIRKKILVEVHGIIVPPRGNRDFGWCALFQEDGSSVTYGEMTDEERAHKSMRGTALRELRKWLEEHNN